MIKVATNRFQIVLLILGHHHRAKTQPTGD